MTVSLTFGHNTGVGRTIFAFSKDANNYWRIFIENISTLMRISFIVVQNGTTLLHIRTPYNTRNLGYFHVVASTSPTGNAFYVNGTLLTVYTTGTSSVGLNFSDLDVQYGAIGALLTSATTVSGAGGAGSYSHLAILKQFPDAPLIERLNEVTTRKFANLHIREFHQASSYSSKSKGFNDVVLTFNTENSKKQITKKTIGHTLSRLVDFVRTPFTLYFTDDALNKVNVPDGTFQAVIKFWRVDD
jgi:hypothetical protein